MQAGTVLLPRAVVQARDGDPMTVDLVLRCADGHAIVRGGVVLTREADGCWHAPDWTIDQGSTFTATTLVGHLYPGGFFEGTKPFLVQWRAPGEFPVTIHAGNTLTLTGIAVRVEWV